jgi:hypothetical protein
VTTIELARYRGRIAATIESSSSGHPLPQREDRTLSGDLRRVTVHGSDSNQEQTASNGPGDNEHRELATAPFLGSMR